MPDLAQEELEFLVNNLDQFPMHEQVAIREMIEAVSQRTAQQSAQLKFLDFMRTVEPSLLVGPQHKIIGDCLERIAAGTLKRLIIAIAPRHSKSTVASYLFPAWFMGKFPHKKVIMASHTGDLAVDFGRKVRNLIASPIYSSVFPNVALSADSKAAGRWNTSHGGEYFALGVGAAMAGRGGDCLSFSCKVLTSKGKIQLSKVKVGDYVYGFDHKTGKNVWTRVSAISTQRKQNLVRYGALVCTADHRIFGRDGYCPASEVRNVAVLPMWSRISEAEKNSRTIEEHLRAGAKEFLLLDGVFAPEEQECLVCLRKPEKLEGDNLQSVLPAREAYRDDVHDLREGVQAGGVGTREELEVARTHRQCVLQSSMLSVPQTTQTETASGIEWGVSDLQSANTQREKVLQLSMLCDEEGESRGLRREVEHTQTRCDCTRQQNLCLLRADETRHGSSSHRPQRVEQQHVEFDTSLRELPQPLSFSRVGVCADDFTSLLRGEGEQVVDIQTGTHNFYCEGVLVHNCVIIDDPFSEQEARSGNPAIYDGVYEWFMGGPRQRLQPGGAIIVLATRWNKRDLSGRLIENMIQNPDADQWEVVELPAILPSGKPLWPDFWSLEELLKVKASIDPRYWSAQYMQQPLSEEGAIIKREWWRAWTKGDPPDCEYIIGSLDAAAETNNRNDHTSLTVWGVFYRDDEATGERTAHIILLESIRRRMEYVELKDLAYEQYKKWEMDCFIVEKKSNGVALYQEMRRAGVPVTEFTPTRATGDKVSRLNAVADIVRGGLVWYPEGQRWAEELVDEVAGFPNYGSDDRVDTTSMALSRFRQGGFIKLPNDRDFDDEGDFVPVTRKYY